MIDPAEHKRETKSGPSLEAAANLMARIGFLEAEIEGRTKDEQYFANIQPVALGLFRLVVMGEIKKGKSSFINALCGVKDLVPVHHNVATSTIFKIHHGEKLAYSVFFQPETGKSKLEISPTELFDYGTEDGNPNNEKNVDFIAVQTMSQVLQGGLVVVDTPGVGGLFKNHREITFRYAPKADAVFFVTDSVESPIGADEVSFLKELRRVTSFVYFVQTKGADADPEARQKRMENNISILTEKVGIPKDEIRYFVVDSNLKMAADAGKNLEDLKDSGFLPLTAYLNNVLKPSRNRNIATVGLRRASTKLAEIRSVVEKQKLVLDADTAEKQATLSEELKQAEARLNTWNNETRPQLVREFQIQVQTIQTEITATVREKLRPGGAISEEIGGILNQTKTMHPEEIYKMASPLASDARSKASELMLYISQDLESRFVALIEALAKKAGAGIAAASFKSDPSEQELTVIHYADTQLKELVARGEESRFFEKTRTGLYGGMAGVAIASVAGGIIGSVVPVVGTVIGSTVGMLIAGAWGSYQAAEIVRSKESAAARHSVHMFIEKDLASISSQVETGFNKAFNTLRLQAEDALGEMVKTSISQLSTARVDLKNRVRATALEISESRQKVQAVDGQIEGLRQELKAMDSMLG